MTDNVWFVRSPGVDRPFRLYCVPYAGGNAATYLNWQASMPAHVEIVGVQLPGRGARFGEPPACRLDALLDELSAVFQRTADRPYALFGHSLGAWVAFELARRLALTRAEQPQHLFVSGSHAPRLRSQPRDYHRLDDAALIGVLKEYGGTPPEILAQADLMALLLPTIRADFCLAETYGYRPGPPLRLPISVLAGREDDRRDLEQVSGWASETVGGFAAHWFEGNHFFIHSQRDAVVGCIASALPALPSLRVAPRLAS